MKIIEETPTDFGSNVRARCGCLRSCSPLKRCYPVCRLPNRFVLEQVLTSGTRFAVEEGHTTSHGIWSDAKTVAC